MRVWSRRSGGPEPAPYYNTFTAAVAVTFSVLWTSGLYFALRNVPAPTENIYAYAFTIALPPAVFGLLAGQASDRRSAKGYLYLLAGLLLGSLNLLCIRLILAGPGGSFASTPAFLTFLVGQPLTFTALTRLGNTLGTLPPKRPGGVKSFWDWIVEVKSRVELLTDLTKSIGAFFTALVLAYHMLPKNP